MDGSSDQWLSEMMGLDSMQQIATDLDELATGGGDLFPLNYSSYAYPSLLDCSSNMEAHYNHHETALLHRLHISNPQASTSTSSSSRSPNLICFGSTPEYLQNNVDDPKSFSYGAVGDLTRISTIHVKPKKEEIEVSNSQGTFISQHHGFKSIQGTNNNKRDSNGATKPKAPSTTNLLSNYTSQDHVLAERKRRERLNQHFIALSALVPGLKKMDKATVLGDATTYLKQLKDRVKKLEEDEQKAKNSSAIALMSTTTGGHYDDIIDDPLPEIEARCYDDKNISIRIHCERRKGVLVKILAEIEKLHLTVVHSSVMPFADTSLYVTVISQMDVDFSMTLKDLVKNLKSSLRD